MPILSPQSAFAFSGAIDLQRFEDKNLPTLSLNVPDAELTWGSVNLGLGQSPFAIEPNGHLLAEFPAQTLDLLAGAGDQEMQLLVTRPGELDVDDFCVEHAPVGAFRARILHGHPTAKYPDRRSGDSCPPLARRRRRV